MSAPEEVQLQEHDISQRDEDTSGGSSVSNILAGAEMGRSSVESLKEDVSGPIKTSTPVGSDSDDLLQHLGDMYQQNQQQIIKLMEQRRKKREEQRQKLSVPLYVDEQYAPHDYNLQLEEYQQLEPKDYMRVCMAKMTYHITKTAEAYEQAYNAMSDIKERDAANQAFLRSPSTPAVASIEPAPTAAGQTVGCTPQAEEQAVAGPPEDN